MPQNDKGSQSLGPLLLLFLCSEFEARPVDSEVATQPLLQEPRRVTGHYAAGDSEDGDAGKVRGLMGRGGGAAPNLWCCYRLYARSMSMFSHLQPPPCLPQRTRIFVHASDFVPPSSLPKHLHAGVCCSELGADPRAS